MSIVFLNNEFTPMEAARISPMDRGFLFGDGIYEVVPSYGGKMIGFTPHFERMQSGLDAIGIQLNWSLSQWRELATTLMRHNGEGNLGLYFHVSRGMEATRNHAFPTDIQPTVFAFTFEIGPAKTQEYGFSHPHKVITSNDLRWSRCHIKSTALLGNVLHYQQGQDQGCTETILFNENDEMTEGSACNVFIVSDGKVITPPLDHQLLPGITRLMLLDILKKDGRIEVEERIIGRGEFESADEVWLTSATKEIGPVVSVDGRLISGGIPGPVWQKAQQLFAKHRFSYD